MPESLRALLTGPRLLWAGVFVSGLVATSFFLSLVCSGWPLVMYFFFGGVGALLGPRLHRRGAGEGLVATILRRGASGLAVFSAVGLIMLCFMPVNWDTKCAWRYCGRALGVGLLESPFPVGTPSCRGWSMCVNEYPYSDIQYRRALSQIRRQDCPEP